jgi:hypothetical protein
MSEMGKRFALGAAHAVENSLASVTKDFESGVGAFFSGGHAETHSVKPTEIQMNESSQNVTQERTSEGQIIANQDVNGTPAYLVATENAHGEPEKVLIGKGNTDFQVGQDVVMSWGKDGQLLGMEEQREYGL